VVERTCATTISFKAALKMLDVKMTDVKLTDQFAGHEIAGREIAGHETTGHKRARCETGSDAINV